MRFILSSDTQNHLKIIVDSNKEREITVAFPWHHLQY